MVCYDRTYIHFTLLFRFFCQVRSAEAYVEESGHVSLFGGVQVIQLRVCVLRVCVCMCVLRVFGDLSAVSV